jgi:hypothetical protein
LLRLESDVFADFGEHLRGDAEALGFAATNGTQERGEVLQGKMLNNAGTVLQQQLIAFAGCGASVRSMRSRIKGWERYVNKENTENMKKEGRKVPEM